MSPDQVKLLDILVSCVGGRKTNKTTEVCMQQAEEARRQNGLTVQYVRDARGRIVRKTEQFNGSSNVLGYAYDADGRLTEVKNNAAIAETYKYNASGQRVRSKVWYEGCPSASTSAMEKSRYSYNAKVSWKATGKTAMPMTNTVR